MSQRPDDCSSRVVRARLAHLGFVLGQLDDLRAAHQALGRLAGVDRARKLSALGSEPLNAFRTRRRISRNVFERNPTTPGEVFSAACQSSSSSERGARMRSEPPEA